MQNRHLDNFLKRCINCGINASNRTLSVTSLVYKHKTILSQWTAQELPADGQICVPCLDVIERYEDDENPPRKFGHQIVCIGCGLSQFRKKHKVLAKDEDLKNLSVAFPWYKQVKTEKYIVCQACLQHMERKKKIKKELEDKILEDNDINETNSDAQETLTSNVATFEGNCLILPGYKLLSKRRRACIVPKCKDFGSSVSVLKRREILLQTNMLTTTRSGLCKQHLNYNKWDSLASEKSRNNFSMRNMEELISLCERPPSIVDFDRINDMPNHLCKYWTGLEVEEFKELYEKLNVDTSQFQSLRNALAIYLLRKKTGDSLVKLANLFLMSTQLLSRQLLVIEKCYETIDSALFNNK